ncbi:MAG: M10 family metallopeptidase C-terminal domain-containing protein, partial [Hydrogenophilaceae bacterium]|nr:M10 family metallopeptidase C-terminal domain-containing protein [Hydrogenophilaceae bacterium]
MSARSFPSGEHFFIRSAPAFHYGPYDASPFDSVGMEAAREWSPQLSALRGHAARHVGKAQDASETAPKTSAGDTIPANASTTFTLAIGGEDTGFVNTPGDDDWFRVELTAGQSYVFTLSGDGATPLSDPYLELYNASGQLIAIDDDAGPGLSSMLRFTATESGTYYLNARAWEAESGPTLTGGYRVTAALGPPQDPLDTIDFGFATPMHIDVYFAASGETFGGNTALRSWTTEEINAAMTALATFSAVANLTFSQSATSTGAEFILFIADLEDNVLGQFTVTGGSIGYGEFAPDGAGWTSAGLAPGGLGFVTLIHEFGHGLGLTHPHDNSGNSEIMQGVVSPFNSFGTFLLNQGVFTTMTYNDGWASVFPNTILAYGAQATPMALDIALLQQRYGANQSTNTGDTTYTMPVVNAGGTLFQCIWDAGGVDTISAGVTTLAATINLNAATLLNAIGGGGYVSSHTTIRGGFTIASGVVIENAVGGGGADTLIGNSAANRLTGAAGADSIDGGSGVDTSVYTIASTSATWVRNLNGSWTVTAGADGTDTVANVEFLD